MRKQKNYVLPFWLKSIIAGFISFIFELPNVFGLISFYTEIRIIFGQSLSINILCCFCRFGYSLFVINYE